MLATHLFSKNIRNQITLPFQWLNVTVNVIRVNSSSSDSSSDSDTDSESAKKFTTDQIKSVAGTSGDNISISKNAATNKRSIDYLYSVKEVHKKRQIEKQFTKAAQMLTTSGGKDKEKVLSTLLDSISNICTENNSNTFNKINRNNSKTEYKNQTEHKMQIHRQRNAGKDFQAERRDQEPLSISRMLQNQQRKTNNIDDKFVERKHSIGDEPSIIRMLQNQQQKTENVYKPRTKMQGEEEPSIIRMLQNQKINTEKTFSKVESKPKPQEPSIIRTLQQQQRNARTSKKKIETKREVQKEPSIIKTLQSQQGQIRNINEKGRTGNETQDEPSVIRLLQKQKREAMRNDKIEIKRGIQEINEIINKDAVSVQHKKIFVNEFLESPDVPELKIWNTCEEQEMESLVAHYPENAFQEMIQWTKEGKLWKFPIDNEQGMESEQNVHFSEHVFLDRHLAGWCPTKGPIRHFMELVCVGLSKNPYMTIEEKRDHIMWYKDYFKDKIDLLQKLGLVE